jgi:hypothetical protein
VAASEEEVAERPAVCDAGGCAMSTPQTQPAFAAPAGSVTMPPRGPEPEHIWREQRMWDLICRLSGFANRPDAQLQVAWLVELRDRINDVLQRVQSPNAVRSTTPGGEA